MQEPLSSAKPSAQELRDRVPGWGADLDPSDRPAYPKERQPPRLPAHAQRQPEPQVHDVEVLHSTERPALTPVFGTTLPPRGLSGRVRRYAFGFSENDLRHWLLLLLADRIDVVESLGDDLSRGYVPNLIAEMGLGAEWRYNRPALLRHVVTAAALAGAVLVLWRATRAPSPPRLMAPPPRR